MPPVAQDTPRHRIDKANWTRLPTLPLDDPFLSKDTLKEAANLQAELDKLDDERDTYDRLRNELKTMAPTDELPSDAHTIKDHRRKLLVRELELRKRVVEWYAKERQDIKVALDKASSEDLVQVEADIRKKLVAMGYVDLPGQSGPTISPDMIHRHPAYRTAKARREELFARMNNHSPIALNGELYEKVFEDLKAMRERQLAGL